MAANFYNTIHSLATQQPNDAELGSAVRHLIWKIEDAKKVESDPNQVNIFQDIERYGNRS